MADDIALGLGARDHLLHVAAAHLLERLTGQDMDMPGLGIHRRPRTLGDVDDFLDDGAGNRLLLESAHAPAGLNQRLEVHSLHSVRPLHPHGSTPICYAAALRAAAA